jgi:hypothetical protein
MTDFDYKKYSLENLEKWMSDALISAEATPKEIYDVIHKVVEEEYYYFKHQTGRCYELLALLKGNGKEHLTCDKDDKSPECQNAWNDFWEESSSSEEHQKHTEEVKDDGMQLSYEELYKKNLELKAKLSRFENPELKNYTDEEIDIMTYGLEKR